MYFSAIRQKNHKNIVLLFGIVLGFFVLGSSGFYYEIKSRLCKVEACSVETDKQNTDDRVVVSAYDAVSNVISINLALPVLLSFGEVNSDQQEKEISSTSEIKERLIPYLNTLFRKIISPNAP